MRAESDRRMPLIMVAGIRDEQVERTAHAIRADDEGTVLVHHDLRTIFQGVVRRKVSRGDGCGGLAEQTAVLELAHGCVSCTLREDLLPLLRRLCAAPDVERIVLRLDPCLEPEALSWAIEHVLLDGTPVSADVRVEAVVTAVDVPTWLSDAEGDLALSERGLAGSAEDDRTLAQVAVGQVEFADAIVLHGSRADRWNSARTGAVLRKLTPRAPIACAADLDATALLAAVPSDARRGRIDGPQGALLRGQPDLGTEVGVSVVLFEARRPFHPGRLHEAIDVLLDGVIRARGRAWVASQPDDALWIESAGGGLGVGHAGPWLASVPSEQWDAVDEERRVRASLYWDDYYGDRRQELVVIAHEADPEDVTRALRGALLTDEELAAGERRWLTYDDPFADWHVDPCEELDESRSVDGRRERGTR